MKKILKRVLLATAAVGAVLAVSAWMILQRPAAYPQLAEIERRVLRAPGSEAAAADAVGRSREPVVGLPCEGCEAVFEGLPDSLEWAARIAPESEPGEKMQITGTVRDEIGHPVGNVIVYAYHTNAGGIYPRDESLRGLAAHRHGRFRAWVRTDESGRYRFDTIRPGGYPGTDIPEHVHLHVIEVGRCTYYIDDIEFEDDPRLTLAMRDEPDRARGGTGVAMPTRDPGGTQLVTRDIVLGQNIPGYPVLRGGGPGPSPETDRR